MRKHYMAVLFPSYLWQKGEKSQADECRFETIDIQYIIIHVNNVCKQLESYGFVLLQCNWMMTLQEKIKLIVTVKENMCYKGTLCLESTILQ